jgi:predicted ATPase
MRREPGREVHRSGGCDRAVPIYRLLETTRAYALEKLHESGEFEQVQHRHAAYFEGSLQSGRMK